MKCSTCIEEGKRSQVSSLGGTRTLMHAHSFYDEDGEHHYHDPNTETANYRCSEGHEWQESSKGSCWCGWPEKKAEAPAEEVS